MAADNAFPFLHGLAFGLFGRMLFLGFFFLIGSLFVVVMLCEAYRTALTYGWTVGGLRNRRERGEGDPERP